MPANRVGWGCTVSEVVAWFVQGMDSGNGKMDEEELNRNEERSRLEKVLRELGVQIEISEDLGDLRLLLSSAEPVMLVTELDVPDQWGGWEIVRELRDQGTLLPVMVLSGEGEEADVIAAFEAGGNEYMVKPVRTGEFRVRFLNLLKLTGRRRDRDSLLKVDGLILDPARRRVSRDGNEVTMTPKEFDLLYYLAMNLGEICHRDEILKQVWGYHFHGDTNVIDVYIRHIRMKMDRGYRNKLIHTVRGTGYILKAPEDGANL